MSWRRTDTEGWTQPVSPHGHRAFPREECRRGRRQLDRSGSGQAAVCQRDPVDPLPAGGVCGQHLGVLQRGHRTHIHVLFSAVHFAVYEAYRNGKVEEAMSLGFLLFLFSGDLTSFAGCYLTSQLPIQVVTVVFYIFTDLILISQFLYYKIKNSCSRKNPMLKWMCFMWCGAASLVLLALPKLIIDDSRSLDTQSPATSKSVEITGYICGYLASVFYLCSRFPQLYKNFQRQSTEGTSYLLFALAMMGNGTYGLSVIVVLPALRGSKQTFIIKHLAWLIGSLGVLILDFLVTAQFIIYKKNVPAKKSSALLSVPEVEPLLCEEEELSVL
ncbi:lysosomal amino acid transporter 1 homolog isoform X1 [Amphiprion ocellaris]|uniref:lysosomal amino acid transporter 1 homolog isoform X1 n=1 Tax=Amphiprion ocellaris TaxID=80972 RepID=UPI0024113A6B|nr:lysosomal amino acid transporter 1 homolog isoform X1 [Amphiprion ocellaris]